MLHGIKKIISKYKIILNALSEFEFPDEINETEKLFEGAKKTITVNSYERNHLARKKCIEHYGTSCTVCGFDFAKIYGNIGIGFIHVHHLNQL